MSFLLLKVRRPCLSSLSTLFLRRLSTALPHVYGDKYETSSSSSSSSSFIHPTSIVHPNAIIGQGVSVGPFCTIGSAAKLGDGCLLYPSSHIFGNTELGDHCILMTGAVVGDDLPGQTVFGCNNIIGHHAVVGVKCQDMKYKSGDECFLDVGNNNEFRENVSIHRSSKSGDRTVSQDVPKYSMVAGERAVLRGLNLEGLRRRGFNVTEIKSLRTAYRKIFMPVDAHAVGFEERLTEVEQDKELGHIPAVCSMLQSIRDSFAENRRGICRFRQWSGS